MKTILFLLTVLLSYVSLAKEIEYSNNSEDDAKVNYILWRFILNNALAEDGRVDYKWVEQNMREFEAFLRILSNTKIDDSWTKEERMAYWINVYNAYSIKYIMNFYPLASIKDTTKPWSTVFFEINGEEMSLGKVEHEILRKFGDARIHFAINCASSSCPPIANVPYTGDNLDKLLKRQTTAFINDSNRNIITGTEYKLSQLFRWFKKDFESDAGTIVNFINEYSTIKIESQVNNGFIKYDWNLNDKKS